MEEQWLADLVEILHFETLECGVLLFVDGDQRVVQIHLSEPFEEQDGAHRN